ncbi:MAG: M48 family metallopeptidase [Hydrogenophaga sp.]|uniref:M48 family metallopeptidase n=1 Tax=Hydrogenophaga sp. TaxID=1904254 RepID=UPI001D83935C|nr:M48 family metallopeptidase [Hydrogenophaga sp.]MBX3610025.1 M48 family metallopeptidase [Hydrogenophaga sp.]
MDASALAFTTVFCALLVAGLLVRAYLAGRQMRHVARHRDQVPAPFNHTIGLDAHRKAADYTIAKTRFGLLETAFEAAVLVGWTLMGGLDWLNQTLLVSMGPGLWQQLTLVACFAVIGGLVGLPFAWYATFRLEARFGFNKMGLSLWLVDGLKGAVIGAVIGLPVLALVLWLMGTAGPTWWLWAWGVWMGFNLLALVLYPTLIAPLFNKFEPLTDDTIRARVNALMARCGFSAQGLFVMDGSKRSAHANAYFTGFGAAKRVVFFDTLLNQLSPDEIDAVLAHELGHYRRRHILKRIVMLFGLSLLGFAALGWASSQAWFFIGLGVQPSLQAPNDALALILFVLTVPLLTYFLSPLMAQISRRHEFEADAFAMEKTRGSDLASALLKLYQDNASTVTPDPLYASFYYSHPPASERLARLQTA